MVRSWRGKVHNTYTMCPLDQERETDDKGNGSKEERRVRNGLLVRSSQETKGNERNNSKGGFVSFCLARAANTRALFSHTTDPFLDSGGVMVSWSWQWWHEGCELWVKWIVGFVAWVFAMLWVGSMVVARWWSDCGSWRNMGCGLRIGVNDVDCGSDLRCVLGIGVNNVDWGSTSVRF